MKLITRCVRKVRDVGSIILKREKKMIIKRWSERAGCRVALWHSATQSPGEPPLFLSYRKLLGGEIRVGEREQRCRHCAPYWSSHKAGIPVAATTLEKDAALLLCPSSHSLSPFSSLFRPAPLPPPRPPSPGRTMPTHDCCFFKGN